MRIFAHRGASGNEPENTLRSFRRALEIGADWMECDVYAVQDELLVFHDFRLERRTNGTGNIWDRNLEYLRSLDAGKGEKIPFLSEVMDLLAGRAGLNVELKGPGTAAPAAALLGKAVSSGPWKADSLLVSSFSRPELAVFHERLPEIPTGALCADVPAEGAAFAQDMECVSLHLPMDRVEPGLVDDAHRLGIAVNVFTVNREEDYRRMRDMCVDGVFTDFPERYVRRTL
jgi:glycerophosphoryl diester phosphodiesterase